MAINLFSGGNTINSLQAAGKNAIINGGMDIWQRGTSIAASASTTPYTADRWQLKNNASQAMTVSRQATSDTTNLPNIQYCARIQRDSGQTGTTVYYFANQFESVNSIPLAGKPVTFSFYARKGANFSPTSSLIGVTLYGGTGTDQNIITGAYTGGAVIATQDLALTTTWQRFTITATVPTTVTELSVFFAATPTGTASTNDYFEVTGVQLELGTTATTFSRAGGSVPGELSLCQRYYNTMVSGATNLMVGIGSFYSSSQLYVGVFFPVSMRIAPSLVATSGTDYYAADRNAGTDLFNSFSIAYATNQTALIYNLSEISSVAGQAGAARTNNASASIAFNAEI